MSFIAVRRSLLTSVPRLGRTFAASSFQLKTVTESVKDAAEKVNRVAADAALKGIETTEQVKNQAVDAAAPMMEKAKDMTSDGMSEAKKKMNQGEKDMKKAGLEAKATMENTAETVKNEADKAMR